MRLLYLICTLLLTSVLVGQSVSLSGNITDARTAEPLVGTTVVLQNETAQYGVVSMANGNYFFEDVTPGRYTLQISYTGYEPIQINGFLVGSGPETGRDFVMQVNPSLNLPDVVVRSSPLLVNPLSKEVTLEAVRRLPATFYDPARLLALSPGVAQTNDQANHLSVRGNSPNANLWRLQGLAIVNPNHTANAGTATDYPTLSGGGVNAISAQLLDNSTFYAAGLPIAYGNATGGTFDMQLRPGNNQRRQHQVQAGFIGFDLATEGPIGKPKPNSASYLLNYRYSFTGLLADMGVDFGGETIRFQDVSLHLHQPLANGGELSVFGLYGSSSNFFTAPEDSTEITEEKELFEIDFESDVFVAGFQLNTKLGKGNLRFGSAYSTTESKRLIDETRTVTGFEAAFNLEQTRLNMRVDYSLPVGNLGQLLAGLEWLQDEVALTGSGFTRPPATGGETAFKSGALAPYLSWEKRSRNWLLQAGLRIGLYPDQANETLEPRFLVTRYANKNRFTLALEASSQLPTLALLGALDRELLEVPTSYQASLAWNHTIQTGLQLQFVGYYRETPDDYARNLTDGGFVPANSLLINELGEFNARTDTRGFGLEASLHKAIEVGDWYYTLNASVFQTEYTDGTGEWLPARFAHQYNVQAVVGKEWAGNNRKDRSRNLGVNLAILTRGGNRAAPIALAASRAAADPTPIYNYQAGFSEQLPAYFRPDLRLYKRLFSAKTTTTLALDIQNVAGIENTAYYDYDNFTGQIEARQQLSLIPVLSYRIEWR